MAAVESNWAQRERELPFVFEISKTSSHLSFGVGSKLNTIHHSFEGVRNVCIIELIQGFEQILNTLRM